MRDSTNPDEANERDGSEDPSVTPPHKDDLRSIMFGRPIQRSEPIETGQYSAEPKSDAEPAWSDTASDANATDDPPWQGRDIDLADESIKQTYERPPFYTSSEDPTDRLHPEEVARFGPPAGFGRRLVAHLIDITVTLFILSLLFSFAVRYAIIRF